MSFIFVLNSKHWDGNDLLEIITGPKVRESVKGLGIELLRDAIPSGFQRSAPGTDTMVLVANVTVMTILLRRNVLCNDELFLAETNELNW